MLSKFWQHVPAHGVGTENAKHNLIHNLDHHNRHRAGTKQCHGRTPAMTRRTPKPIRKHEPANYGTSTAVTIAVCTTAEVDGAAVAPVAEPDKVPVTVPTCDCVPTVPACAVPV